MESEDNEEEGRRERGGSQPRSRTGFASSDLCAEGVSTGGCVLLEPCSLREHRQVRDTSRVTRIMKYTLL